MWASRSSCSSFFIELSEPNRLCHNFRRKLIKLWFLVEFS
jgi:hypothetical protein